MDPRPWGPARGGGERRGEAEEGGRRKKVSGAVVSFNMHSPGEEEQAALSAGAPVWPP